MADSPQSIEAGLIRFRIEKRMAGRRDLLLHLLLYVAVAVIVLLNAPWLDLVEIFSLGVTWTIPLVLHGLRYYYRCGRGAIARADEIERAIEFQAGGTMLDEDEELLIEERAGKRIAARRIVVAHLVTTSMLLALLWIVGWLTPYSWNNYNYMGRINASSVFAIAFALHALRFFFVHGRTPAGRALKIEAEVERLWHQSRERRQEADDADAAADTLDLGLLRGRRVRLNDDGEFDYGTEGEDAVTGQSASL